jgi:hypothetical protein
MRDGTNRQEAPILTHICIDAVMEQLAKAPRRRDFQGRADNPAEVPLGLRSGRGCSPTASSGRGWGVTDP